MACSMGHIFWLIPTGATTDQLPSPTEKKFQNLAPSPLKERNSRARQLAASNRPARHQDPRRFSEPKNVKKFSEISSLIEAGFPSNPAFKRSNTTHNQEPIRVERAAFGASTNQEWHMKENQQGPVEKNPVSYTHLTLPTNREV